MKKGLAICLVVVLGLAGNSLATVFTGSIVSSIDNNFNPTGTLIGLEDWKSGAQLSWSVDDQTYAGLWTYTYTFSAERKDISHGIIEVSDTFTSANIFAGTTGGYDGPKTYSGADPSNPGMPGAMWGIKWNDTATWTIVTDRAPMWGDFYAVDGKGGALGVLAYNSGYGAETTAAIGDGNAGGWILTPDTQSGVIPEPGTFLLLGSGLLGIAFYQRRRAKK